MPYPNEHAARVADPNRFSTCRSKSISDGIRILTCKLKNSNEWRIQTYRFDKNKFSASAAKA